VDMFRKKSRAPLLVASILGFAGTAFISFYHFFMLDVVMNFDQSHFKVAALWLMVLTAMPMLLAFVSERDLTWQPARWLLVSILAVCLMHLFIPGFTAERPRDMTLMYSEVEGDNTGHIVLESIYRRHDKAYAKGHNFELKELNSGRLGTVNLPVREVEPIGLPGVSLVEQGSSKEGAGNWRRKFSISLPDDSRMLRLSMPESVGVSKAWINGELALDTSIESKQKRVVDSLQIIYPGNEPVQLELLSASPEAFTLAAVTWHDLPGVLVAPFMGNWPDEAQPFLFGPRAEKIQEFEISVIEAGPVLP